MKSTTNFTGALSSASNSIPCDERPNDATTSSIRSDDACGIAIPNPIPVLIVSSRCLSEARMLSRSSGLIFPWATRRLISSTIALQRSVAFISGMICSAVSRLAKDMQDSQWGRKLNVRLSDDKRDLALRSHLVIQSPRKEPADAEHVHRGAPGAIAEPVFTLAKFSRPMIDRDLDEAETCAFDERGNKTVHAFERDERVDGFALHRFQGAAGIADAVFREAAPDEIRDAARDPFYDRVFALDPITANEIGAALDFREQLSNVRRIVLQIAID